MQQCQKCQGLVPETSSSCPNCRATSRWWKTPLAMLGAGLATVTLSACYGSPCATTITLPDGGTTVDNPNAGRSCGTVDCRTPERTEDGGIDPAWEYACEPYLPASDAGVTDGGTDAGP